MADEGEGGILFVVADSDVHDAGLLDDSTIKNLGLAGTREASRRGCGCGGLVADDGVGDAVRVGCAGSQVGEIGDGRAALGVRLRDDLEIGTEGAGAGSDSEGGAQSVEHSVHLELNEQKACQWVVRKRFLDGRISIAQRS